ncbi:hypothetical protein J437_LFUL009141 [Ladona fulva]|uniref:Lipase domain-containing protein n=1 Tax=Ladona fulva TaxID=123851 RepID=A0A8K0P1A2_LADFU|nr:hypothetical protein J437_LFUL009141 [Ladona fulva]
MELLTLKMKNMGYSLNLLLVISFLFITPAQLNEIPNDIDMEMEENDSVMDVLEHDASNMTDMSDMSTAAIENMILTMDKEVKCLGFPKKLFKVIGGVFKPLDEEKVDVQFFLTTRKVREWKQIPTKPSISFEGLDLDPNRIRTIFIVHGFLSRAKTAGWVEDMANALLGWSDVNVIIVDWHSSWRYWRAVGNTRVVGKAMTDRNSAFNINI